MVEVVAVAVVTVKGRQGGDGGRRIPLLKSAPSRHPVVPTRRVALTEELAERQVARGLFVTEQGVPYAIPVDHLRDRSVFLGREMWRESPRGAVYRPGAMPAPRRFNLQQRALAWARDHVDERIPYWYYLATLGHDLHVAAFGDLYGKHWHAGWANPFEPDNLRPALDPEFTTFFATHWEPGHIPDVCRLGKRCPATLMTPAAWRAEFAGRLGFVEHLGWLSGAKVTTAFVSNEIDNLVGTNSEYADYDYHEVGTSSTAESNSHTALQATSGISRATGTPTDADPIYRTVATVTADSSETWEEHGVFNNSSGPAMMDRNLTGGQSVVSSDQVQYTYELTKQAEA